MTRIAVIGAGAVGLCCAIALASRGAKVVLIERGLPGAANSTLTGGGIRQQFGTEPNIELSKLSAPFWESFGERFGVDPLFKPVGYLFIAHDAAQAAALQANVTLQGRLGVASEFIDGAAAATRWPLLANRGVTATAFRQLDGWANQHRIIDGLTRGALALGVDVRVGIDVLALAERGGRITGVSTTDGTIDADATVLASGPWTSLLDPLGLGVPVVGRRHELLLVEPAAPLPAQMPWLIGMRDQIHIRPDTPGRALVGGFLGRDDAATPDRYDTRADANWTADVLNKCSEVFGVVDSSARVLRGWAGLYPSTPDHHPIIDRIAEGLYATMGFSGTGLMHAPAAGQLTAELIFDGTTATAHAPFAASRFGAAKLTSERTGF